MTYSKFKEILYDYCMSFGYPQQNKKTIKNLHHGYEESLWRAPVPDNDVTVAQYLDYEFTEGVCSINKKVDMFTTISNGCVNYFEFDSCSKQYYPVSAPTPKAVCKSVKTDKKEEGNNPMNTKYYIEDRIYQISNNKTAEMKKQFGLTDDASPNTAAELVKRIQDGKYVLPAEKEDYGIRSIRWRDPSVVEDKDGFNAAYKAMTKAQTDVIDVINVVSDEQARLKALKDFEAWTPTGVAS